MWKKRVEKVAARKQKQHREKCLKFNGINWQRHAHRTTLTRWKLKIFDRATVCTLYSSHASHAAAPECVNQNWFHYLCLFFGIFHLYFLWLVECFWFLAFCNCCRLLGIDWHTQPINPYQRRIHAGSIRWKTIECDCIHVQSSGHRWTTVSAIRPKGKRFVFCAYAALFDVTGKLSSPKIYFFSTHQSFVLSLLRIPLFSSYPVAPRFWLIALSGVAEQLFHTCIRSVSHHHLHASSVLGYQKNSSKWA